MGLGDTGCLAEPIPDLFQGLEDLAGIGGARSWRGLNDHIRVRESIAVEPIGLSNKALDPVTVDRALGIFLGDSNAQPAHVGGRDEGECVEQRCPDSAARFEQAKETGAAGQATLAREPADRPQTGVSLARPLARRAFRTRRPPRVRIRARKPWVRARLSLLG